MSNFIIKNIASFPVNFHVKEGRRDLTVNLRPGEFIFSNNDEDTRSLIIHKRKKILEITNQEKPKHLDFFRIYTSHHLSVNNDIVIPAPENIEQEIEGELIEQVPQDEYKGEFLVTKEEADDLHETASVIANMLDQVLSGLSITDRMEKAQKEVEDYSEEKSEGKKRKSRRGRGRPKKRGRKKKKNPVGRPRSK